MRNVPDDHRLIDVFDWFRPTLQNDVSTEERLGKDGAHRVGVVEFDFHNRTQICVKCWVWKFRRIALWTTIYIRHNRPSSVIFVTDMRIGYHVIPYCIASSSSCTTAKKYSLNMDMPKIWTWYCCV